MGVYMPTVEMPTNCTKCKLRLIVGCNPYKDNGLSPSKERRKDCPLVEVKIPHGRLIDIDKIMDANTNWELGMTKVPTFEELVIAPTVIEAESDEDCRTCKNYNTEKCNMCGIEADYYEAEVERCKCGYSITNAIKDEQSKK